MKKRMLILMSLFIFAIIILIFFSLFTNKPNDHKNGFTRVSIKATISLTKKIHFSDDLLSICGMTEKNIFFSTFKLGEIIITDYEGSKKNKINVQLLSSFEKLRNATTVVDSPYVYFFAGNRSTILKVNLNDKIVNKIIVPSPIFIKGIVLSPQLFVLRQFSRYTKDQKFVRYSLPSGTLQEENNISEIHNDGGILSDGTLNYDYKTHKLVYTYYYKNKFCSFDTNFNCLKIGKTIDTFSNYQMDVSSITNGGSKYFTNNTPTRFINTVSSVDDGNLYVYSSIKADNETQKYFLRNMPVDIYDIQDLKYKGSFYLPKIDGKACFDFKIHNDLIIAIYPHIITYFMIEHN